MSRREGSFLNMRSLQVLGTAAAALLGAAGLGQSASAQCTTNYLRTTTVGNTIVPGTSQIVNACDDCSTNVVLPFTWNFYNANYTSINVNSNGYVNFLATDSQLLWNEGNAAYCIPTTSFTGATMAVAWSDGWTSNAGFGIFTSVTGVAPNRIFNVEWRNQYYAGTGSANYELRLYEGQTKFDFIYGTATNVFPTIIGVQNPGHTLSTSAQCNLNQPASGTMYRFDCPAAFGPTVALTTSPTSGIVGSNFVATATTTLGSPPDAITGVTLDETQVGGGAAVPMVLTTPPNIWTVTVPVGAVSQGAKTLTATVTDAAGPNSTGTGTATFTVCAVAAPYTPPAVCTPENEPCLAAPFYDTKNPGCNGPAEVPAVGTIYSNILTCHDYCGNTGCTTANRDTDWYHFTLTSPATVTITGQAQGKIQTYLLSECPAAVQASANNDPTNACTPTNNFTMTASLSAGVHTLWFGAFAFDGTITCGQNSNYWFRITPDTNANCDPTLSTPPNANGRSSPFTVTNCGDQTVTLAVDVAPGTNPTNNNISVLVDLSSIGGSASQTFYDDGLPIHGDATAGDHTFSYIQPISYNVAAGPKTLTFNACDNEAPQRCSSGNFGVNIQACPAIGRCCSEFAACQVVSAPHCTALGGIFTLGGNCGGAGSYAITASATAYVDLSTSGGTIVGGAAGASDCDDCSTALAIPFTFNLYATPFTSVFVHSNGYLQFGVSNPDFSNDAIPTVATPNNALYPMWVDMDTRNAGGGGDIYWKAAGVTPNQTLTIDWVNVSFYNGGGGPISSENFEVVLHENGVAEFVYGAIDADTMTGTGPGGSDYTIGVENSDGTLATSVLGSSIGAGSTALTATYSPPATPCPSRCGTADFNCDGDSGTDSDIEAFFACLGGNCPPPPCSNTANFNGDEDTGTDSDIEAFFRILAGGPC